MLLDAWQRDQAPARPPAAVAGKEEKEKAAPPSAQLPVPGEKLAAGQGAVPKQDRKLPESGVAIRVETDVLIAELSSHGGDVRRVEFKHHRDTVERGKNFVLLESGRERTYVAQAGLIGEGLPNHRTLYAAPGESFRLAEGQDEIEVRMTAQTADGVKVSKIFRFRRGSYLIDVSFEIANGATASLQPYAYFQLVRDDKPLPGDSAMLPTFTGVALYTDKDKFQKIAFSDIEKGKAQYTKNSEDGWVAILQHYFFSAWLPKSGMPREFYARRLEEGLYSVGVIVPVGAIAAGSSTSVTVPLYAGPEEQEKLAKIAPGLELTIDYGWLTVIAVPLFWVLAWIHQWVGNWGVAIIVLTVIIKLLFYPLSAASYRSMARMRVLAPKLQKLKDQYGQDRQRLQQAMMEMYKTEKINPLGGCMPIVVQIPVFIALYWVLLASVELRHAPFMLWINDLAAPDPWFILPILMAVTMWVQTMLNPEPPDPVQARVMKIMPIVFSVFFFFFPAGLVLYWLINNVLSIAQQWQITRVLEREAAARKN